MVRLRASERKLALADADLGMPHSQVTSKGVKMLPDTECWMNAAAEYWHNNQPLDAGRVLFECMPAESRPLWAARILRLVLEKSHTDPRSPFQLVLHSAEHPHRWACAHRAFGLVRDSLLQLDEDVRREGVTDQKADSYIVTQKSMPAWLLRLAELVAKITYNAADPFDPFDYDAGWGIAVALQRFVNMWKDEEFSKEAWVVLSSFQSRMCDKARARSTHGKALQHLESASRHWREGQPLEAGRLIFECLSRDCQPLWAVRIFYLVLNRARDQLQQVTDEDGDNIDLDIHFRRLDEVTGHSRLWPDARRVYDYLGGEPEEEPQELTEPWKLFVRVDSLARLVAKVAYNSSDPPDPFDESSGGRIAESLRWFVDWWKEEEFLKAAWSAICFPFRPV